MSRVKRSLAKKPSAISDNEENDKAYQLDTLPFYKDVWPLGDFELEDWLYMIRSTSKSAINLIMSILSTFGLEQLYVYELKPIFSCIPCGIRQSIKPRPKTKNEYIKAIAKYLKLPQLCDGIAKTRTLLLLDHLQVHLLKNSQLSYDSIEKKRLWKKLGYSTPINDHERQIIYAAAYCYKDSTYVASRDIYDNRLVLSFSIDQLYNPMAFLKENANLSAKDDADDSSNVNNASIWLYIYDYDQLESICLVDALSNQATLLVNGKRVAVLNQEHSTKYDYGVDITSCLDINKINNWLGIIRDKPGRKKVPKAPVIEIELQISHYSLNRGVICIRQQFPVIPSKIIKQTYRQTIAKITQNTLDHSEIDNITILQQSLLNLKPALIPNNNQSTKDDELIMEDEIVSLICPLGLSRIIHPAKGFECLHRQCFDLETFIKFHEHSINLCCTICNKELNYKDLQIDGIFILALQQYPNDIRCIVKPDGTTSAIIATSNVDVVDVSIEDAEYTCSKYNNSIILVDDDEDSDTNTSNTSNNVYYYSKKRVLDKLHVSKDRHIRSFYHKRYRSTSFSDTQPNSNTDVIIID